MQNNKNRDQQNFIRHLLTIAPKHCDNCGSKYSENDFKIVKTSNVNTVLHLKCKTCGNAYMLNVMNPVNGMVGSQRVPINIDLSSGDEIQKFAGKESISRNEAIDTYNEIDSSLTLDKLSQLLS